MFFSLYFVDFGSLHCLHSTRKNKNKNGFLISDPRPQKKLSNILSLLKSYVFLQY